jgi:hypothetical protein
LFPEEGGELIIDLWTELGTGTISQEVLIFDSVKEGGIGLSGKDQFFARGVAGQVESEVTIISCRLPLRPFLSRQ